jgi:hypothetical protein
MSDHEQGARPASRFAADVVKGRADPEELAAIATTLGELHVDTSTSVVTALHRWREVRRAALAKRRG